jgi:hypothetical protein
MSRNLPSATQPYCYDGSKKLFALAHAAAYSACSFSAIMPGNCTNRRSWGNAPMSEFKEIGSTFPWVRRHDEINLYNLSLVKDRS